MRGGSGESMIHCGSTGAGSCPSVSHATGGSRSEMRWMRDDERVSAAPGGMQSMCHSIPEPHPR
jgi:hypothetical protein